MQTGNGLANQPTASNANNTRKGDIITEEVITPALAEKMLKLNRKYGGNLILAVLNLVS